MSPQARIHRPELPGKPGAGAFGDMTTRTESQKFAALARRIERDAAKLALCWHEGYRDDAKKLLAACDRLSDRVRWALADVDCLLAAEILFGVCSRLRAAVVAAREAAGENCRACLVGKSEELQKAVRTVGKELGGYEHELRTKGVGYGPGRYV